MRLTPALLCDSYRDFSSSWGIRVSHSSPVTTGAILGSTLTRTIRGKCLRRACEGRTVTSCAFCISASALYTFSLESRINMDSVAMRSTQTNVGPHRAFGRDKTQAASHQLRPHEPSSSQQIDRKVANRVKPLPPSRHVVHTIVG